MRDCPVCQSTPNKQQRGNGHYFDIDCPRCGPFRVSDTCLTIIGGGELLNTRAKKASVGHWLHLKRAHDMRPMLRSADVERLAESPALPSLTEQRENLLLKIGKASGAPGLDVSIDTFRHQFAIGAAAPASVRTILDHLARSGLVTYFGIGDSEGEDEPDFEAFEASLTFEGWLAFEELARGKTSGKTAFMAMPFKRNDLDEVWFPRLVAAVEQTGFALKRTIDEPKPGLIDIAMREQIKRARFLIVELTHANNGAYWEAGYAEGLGKPVIYTLRTDCDKAHFDVEHSYRVEWSTTTMDKALKHLQDVIRNALPDAALPKE